MAQAQFLKEVKMLFFVRYRALAIAFGFEGAGRGCAVSYIIVG
jgi:hypothetical protein